METIILRCIKNSIPRRIIFHSDTKKPTQGRLFVGFKSRYFEFKRKTPAMTA